ncbi:MAG: CrtD protein, partial [Methylacidiphilales bacterium]|nr:CrtD protein [Candidatus Methylacidiphilales bacterium]
IVNGDVAAVASGLFGPEAARVVPRRPVAKRSFSAITFSMLAEARGFPLIRHNFFFSRDYRTEFADIVSGRLPVEPTVYLCAQDRNDNGLGDAGGTDQDRHALGGKAVPRERLFHQLNVVARGDAQTVTQAEIEAYAKRTFSLLDSCGLIVKWRPEDMVVSTPTDFHRRFPATGGALYGQVTHGWRAPFQRPSVRTSLPGLYLAGGSTHPGAGVPMATLSGRTAAACLAADIASD